MKGLKLGFLSFSLCSALFAEQNLNNLILQHEENLVKEVIPSTKVLKVERAQIDGFYKAHLENGNIIYINPFNRAIFIGELYTAGGISVTAKDREEWQVELSQKELKKISVEMLLKDSKAIQYGKGSKDYEFVIFTDPECPYCIKLEEWLEKQNIDVWVNFSPLTFHKNAKKWSLEILSAKNFKNAMHISRTTQKDQNIVITQKAKDTLKAMQTKAEKLNIQGTPQIFVINKAKNSIVEKVHGANIPKLSKYIKEIN